MEYEEDGESGEEDERPVDARHDVGCPRQAASSRDEGCGPVLTYSKIPRLWEDQGCLWKRVDL